MLWNAFVFCLWVCHFFEILSSSCFVHGTSCTYFILESFVTHNSMNDKCCLGEKDDCKLNA